MQALSWVVVKPAPRDFIENFVGASDFWANKVRAGCVWGVCVGVAFDCWGAGCVGGLTHVAHTIHTYITRRRRRRVQVRIQHKKTSPEHVAFVDAYKKLILDLMGYVKEWHTTGVAWNAQGVDIDAYSPSAAPAPSASAPAAAPAPASAPAPISSAESGGGGRAALFSQLGKGLSITSGLKKVGKEQQTWRAEFKANQQDAAPASAAGAGVAAAKSATGGSKPAAAATKGPPK